MIENSWNTVKLICGNHAEPVDMILKEGADSMFYACPEHIHVYGNITGIACKNRLSPKAYEEMLEFLQHESGAGTPFVADMTGYFFSIRNVDYLVFKQETIKSIPHFRVAVLNKKAISQ